MSGNGERATQAEKPASAAPATYRPAPNTAWLATLRRQFATGAGVFDARTPDPMAGCITNQGAATVATTQYDGALRRWVTLGGKMDKAFVNDELVCLGGHGVAIQCVEPTEALGCFHGDVLEATGALVGRCAACKVERCVVGQGNRDHG